MHRLVIFGCCAIACGAAPRSVRDVDWRNSAYPLLETDDVPEEVRWMALGSGTTVKLVDGRHAVSGDCGSADLCPTVTYDSVGYGAVAAIKSTVAAVVLTYHSGGTAHWQYVYVFTVESGVPRLLAWLRTGSRAYQGLRGVSIAGGNLILEVNDPEWRQGDCCSAGTIAYRYRWAKGSFTAIGQPVFKTDPPSVDRAKAATPAELLQ